MLFAKAVLNDSFSGYPRLQKGFSENSLCLLQGPPGKRGSRGPMGEPGPKVCIALVDSHF